MKTVLSWSIISAVASWLIGFPSYRVLRRIQLFDQPNSRSSHSVATVRGGGIGFALVVMILVWASNLNGPHSIWTVWIGLCGILASVSFIDDIHGLSWRARLSTHFISAAIFVSMVVDKKLCYDWDPISTTIFGCILSVSIAGYINAYNFMDGINGLAAGQAVITGIGTVVLTAEAGITNSRDILICISIIGGGALGFLPYNFPRPRMFMGDVGSVFLGFALMSCAVMIAARNDWAFLFPLSLLHANFILDTAITCIRRVRRGEGFYKAHREHFYQRLVRAGKGHVAVTGIEISLQVVVIAALVIYVRTSLLGKCCLAGFIVLLWLAFFAVCEASFRCKAQIDDKQQ